MFTLIVLIVVVSLSSGGLAAEKEGRKIADLGKKLLTTNFEKGQGSLGSGPTLLQKTLRVGLIADQDNLSQDPRDEKVWKSLYKQGNLTVKGVYPDKVSVSIEWEDDFDVITSGYNFGRSGMELSTLNYFDGNLYACGDKTGILFRLHKEEFSIIPTPWVILADGNFEGKKGFKCEWATVKDDHLYMGSHGTGKDVEGKTATKKYVKKIAKDGAVTVMDWKENYEKIASALNVTSSGYVTHEAAGWSEALKRWVFAPRRVSQQQAYSKPHDEVSGSNAFLLASEDFNDIEVRTAGEFKPTHGFASFKFMPFEKDQIIVALKSVETQVPRSFETYFMAFDIKGNVILPETKIDDHKYEGLEFV